VWARRHKVPVHICGETVEALRAGPFSSSLERVGIVPFAPGERFEAAGLLVEAFATSHDAAAPVGLRIRSGEATLGYATDLGTADETVVEGLSGADFLFLESNHDERMLDEGPYPRFLKARIRSSRGHLSNGDSARLLERLVHPGLRAVVLGHLSEVNNEPVLAYRLASSVLAEAGAGEDVTLLVARQDRPGRVVRLKAA